MANRNSVVIPNSYQDPTEHGPIMTSGDDNQIAPRSVNDRLSDVRAMSLKMRTGLSSCLREMADIDQEFRVHSSTSWSAIADARLQLTSLERIESRVARSHVEAVESVEEIVQELTRIGHRRVRLFEALDSARPRPSSEVLKELAETGLHYVGPLDGLRDMSEDNRALLLNKELEDYKNINPMLPLRQLHQHLGDLVKEAESSTQTAQLQQSLDDERRRNSDLQAAIGIINRELDELRPLRQEMHSLQDELRAANDKVTGLSKDMEVKKGHLASQSIRIQQKSNELREQGERRRQAEARLEIVIRKKQEQDAVVQRLRCEADSGRSAQEDLTSQLEYERAWQQDLLLQSEEQEAIVQRLQQELDFACSAREELSHRCAEYKDMLRET